MKQAFYSKKEITRLFNNYSVKPCQPRVIPYDELHYDRNTKAVDFTKHCQVTSAESRLKRSLLIRLNHEQISGELSCQEILIIPIKNKRAQNPTLQKQLKPLLDRLPPDAQFTRRRPDFLFLKYGFAIEVDGDSHDRIDPKTSRDLSREAEYELLGIKLFRISNDQVSTEASRSAFINDIIRHIRQTESNPIQMEKAYQQRRTAISRWRGRYKSIDNSANIGSPKASKARRLIFNGNVLFTKKQFGGIRYWFNFTRKTKSSFKRSIETND